MTNRIYPLAELEIPMSVIDKCGPFHEFSQDASMVSIELKNGVTITGVLIVYPNYIGAIEGEDDLMFSPNEVVKVFQTPEDLKKRSKSSWSWLYDPTEFSRL
jgi:hypothetical protein